MEHQISPQDWNRNTTADRRVAKSRAALEEAFTRLMQERNYESLRVDDILQTSGVSRKTFYRHYADKKALLQQVLARLMGEIQGLIRPDATLQSSEENTLNAFRWADKHSKLLLVMLRSPAGEHYGGFAYQFLYSEGERDFSGGALPDALAAHHFANGIIGLVRWWLENDKPYPPEVMAEYANTLLIRPLKGA
jgi:AcrR family transcriptional regulator